MHDLGTRSKTIAMHCDAMSVEKATKTTPTNLRLPNKRAKCETPKHSWMKGSPRGSPFIDHWLCNILVRNRRNNCNVLQSSSQVSPNSIVSTKWRGSFGSGMTRNWARAKHSWSWCQAPYVSASEIAGSYLSINNKKQWKTKENQRKQRETLEY